MIKSIKLLCRDDGGQGGDLKDVGLCGAQTGRPVVVDFIDVVVACRRGALVW